MELKNRLDVLRDSVVADGGLWTTRRVLELLEGTEHACTVERARLMLNRLADEGFLTRWGTRGTHWTPTCQHQQPEVQTSAKRVRAYLDELAVSPSLNQTRIDQLYTVDTSTEPVVELLVADLTALVEMVLGPKNEQ